MPADLHREPYVHLAGLSHAAALLSWGAFFFRPGGRGGTARAAESADPDALMVVDDEAFDRLQPSRKDSIGLRSRSYGAAVVRLYDSTGALLREVPVTGRNHVWIDGLSPDTAYSYGIEVDGQDWLQGDRYDWQDRPEGRGLARSGRSYSTRFRTHPAPETRAPLAFAVLGDFGVGIRTDRDSARHQRNIARGLEQAVDQFGIRLVLTTGDNIYLGREHTSATGDEDDDWFFTFYQPYRYVLSRVPFYPAVGNHDASDTEQSDDRAQLEDNYFLAQRFSDERDAERASIDPGLFYRFRYGADVEFVCIDTTRGPEGEGRFFESEKHRPFLDESFPPAAARDPWRIPFSHHPVFCAGPSHPNTQEMLETLVPRFEASGVRLVLAGHEHNFQYSQYHGVHYVLSGAGGKLRSEAPRHFDRAHTIAWASQPHFLVVQLGESDARVHALTLSATGTLEPIALTSVGGEPVRLPLTIAR